MAQLNTSIRRVLVKHYVINVLECGGLPSFRKPMVVTLAEITSVFSGFTSLLPPLPDGGSYAPDTEFVVWLTTPNSKNVESSIHGSLYPMAKPKPEWEADARSNANFAGPSSSCWSPFVLVEALTNNPIQLLGLAPNSTEKVIKVRILKALRNASWNVRRMLLLIPMFKFIQSYVVQPAFKYFNEDRIKPALGTRYDNIVIMEGMDDLTISTTDMITAYIDYIKSPDGGTYVPLLKLFHGAYDRFPGYQAHTFDSSNKTTYSQVISNGRTRQRGESPQPSPGGSAIGANGMFNAGAAARSVVSPGKPGAPKSMRGYVDVVSKSKAAAAALASAAGGTPNPVGGGTPTMFGATTGLSNSSMTATPGSGPGPTGSMPPGSMPPGSMAPGSGPPGSMPPGFAGFPGFSPYQAPYMPHPGYNPYMVHPSFNPWATPPTQ